MKALAVHFLKPGKAEIRETQVKDPAPNQVQVKCVANGICMAEVSLFTGVEKPRQYPFIPGHEGIAVVTKVGKDVKHLKAGDYVPSFNWSTAENIDASRLQKFTEPPCDPALILTEPASCVVTAIYSYNITPGDRVLVLGAGFMGLLNVQGLAHCPLAELVVTDVKQHNLDLAKKYGATDVIHSGTPEGKARLEELKERRFDLVVECAGVESTVADAADYVRGGGRLSIFAWHHAPRSLDLGRWHMRGITVLNSAPGIGIDHNVDCFHRAIMLIERGVFDFSDLVTHRHPASDIGQAMKLAARRPPDYIKGVLLFDEMARGRSRARS